MKSRVALLSVMVLAFWSSLALAQEVLSPEPGIEATIGGQISAFQADDFAKAFDFASPNIRNMFGSSDNFGRMVRQGYPMVWRPSDVQFLELREDQGLLWQKVMIQDQAGAFFVLDYQMIETADGWRINGVYLVRKPDLGA